MKLGKNIESKGVQLMGYLISDEKYLPSQCEGIVVKQSRHSNRKRRMVLVNKLYILLLSWLIKVAARMT